MEGARAKQAGRTSDAILVVGFRALGDFVRCHSAIRLIAESHPGRPIDVLVSPAGARIAAYMPGVRNAIEIKEQHGRLGLVERWRAIATVRAQRYRSVYVLPGTYKSALVPFLAGIPERIGYPDEFRFGLVNRFPKAWLIRRMRRRRFRMVDFVCSTAARDLVALPSEWPEPELLVAPTLLAAWQARNRGGDGRPMLTLYTAGTTQSRSWPMERFAAIAEDYVRSGWSVWVCGGAREAPAAAELRRKVPSVVDYTGACLDEAVCQIAASDMFLGVDAGLSHVAAALGVPAVLLYSANARNFAPINRQVVVLAPPLWVSPHNGRPAAIGTDRVTAALETLAATLACAKPGDVA